MSTAPPLWIPFSSQGAQAPATREDGGTEQTRQGSRKGLIELRSFDTGS